MVRKSFFFPPDCIIGFKNGPLSDTSLRILFHLGIDIPRFWSFYMVIMVRFFFMYFFFMDLEHIQLKFVLREINIQTTGEKNQTSKVQCLFTDL